MIYATRLNSMTKHIANANFDTENTSIQRLERMNNVIWFGPSTPVSRRLTFLTFSEDKIQQK